MLVEALTAVAEDSGVKALLGVRSDSGVYPVVAPAGVRMPYISLQQVSSELLDTSLDGPGGLHSDRWRFTAYGTSYLSAKRLASALRDALLALNGPTAAGNVYVQNVQLILEADDAETIPHGTIYSTHVDLEIVFTVSA